MDVVENRLRVGLVEPEVTVATETKTQTPSISPQITAKVTDLVDQRISPIYISYCRLIICSQTKKFWKKRYHLLDELLIY